MDTTPDRPTVTAPFTRKRLYDGSTYNDWDLRVVVAMWWSSGIYGAIMSLSLIAEEFAPGTELLVFAVAALVGIGGYAVWLFRRFVFERTPPRSTWRLPAPEVVDEFDTWLKDNGLHLSDPTGLAVAALGIRLPATADGHDSDGRPVTVTLDNDGDTDLTVTVHRPDPGGHNR